MSVPEQFSVSDAAKHKHEKIDAEETITPEIAMQKLFLVMDELETQHEIGSKEALLEKMTDHLRSISRTEDPQLNKVFRNDSHFQKLKISSKYAIRNAFDRDMHEKIIMYLAAAGIKTTGQERKDIMAFFEKRDAEKKKKTFESYAHHGLLTLKSVLEKGILKETSSTPGDFGSIETVNELFNDEVDNLRGYELDAQNIDDSIFYGRNSFFQVAMERGGESIDRAGQIPKQEAENRLKNSMIFVVNSKKIDISRRAENVHKEDVVKRNILPEEIDYVLVDRVNGLLAREAFSHLPVKIIEVDSVKVPIDGLYDGNYSVPKYKQEIEKIIEKEDSVWCHIARLPVDTYPTSRSEE